MTIAFVVLMSLAGLFAAFWLYSLIAEFWTSKLSSYEEWSDRFFSLSGRLLDRDDLPSGWVDTISTLNSWIDDPSMPAALARVYAKKNQERIKQESAKSSLPAETTEFIKENPDLSGNYISVVRSAFLAISFLAPVNAGADIRAKMAEAWERERSSDPGPAVKEVEAVKASHLKLVHSAA
jgi:hypothetical protein